MSDFGVSISKLDNSINQINKIGILQFVNPKSNIQNQYGFSKSIPQ